MFEWDAFICHASEDKAAVAAPLEKSLRAVQVYAWLDRQQTGTGDSLHGSIGEGLRQSRFGVVILSPSFRRYWAETELAAFVVLEAGTRRRIVPVWHDVDEKFVAEHFPLLLDRRAAKTAEGIGHVADQILREMIKASVEDIDGLLVRLRKSYADLLKEIGSPTSKAQKVDGTDWKLLRAEFVRLQIWVPKRVQKGRWDRLGEHLNWGQVVDLNDIAETDWSSVRQDATDFAEQRN
jgi:TIR domain